MDILTTRDLFVVIIIIVVIVVVVVVVVVVVIVVVLSTYQPAGKLNLFYDPIIFKGFRLFQPNFISLFFPFSRSRELPPSPLVRTELSYSMSVVSAHFPFTDDESSHIHIQLIHILILLF